MTQQESGQTGTEIVAARVRELREARGWSARALAERLRKLDGTRLDRAVLANLESGRRQSVSVDELLLLSIALDCAPVHLLLPFGQLKVGRLSLSADMANRWVVGLVPLPDQDVAQWTRLSQEYAARVGSAGEALAELDKALERLAELREALWMATRAVARGIGIDADEYLENE